MTIGIKSVKFDSCFVIIMLENRIILSLAIALGSAAYSAASPSALPIVDLGYAVHQGTLNKVSFLFVLRTAKMYILLIVVTGPWVSILQLQQY